jgi:hypothetical protein
MEPSFTPTRIGSFFALQAWMTSRTGAVVDVAGFKRILCTPASIASRRALEVEVHVGDDGNANLRKDFL